MKLGFSSFVCPNWRLEQMAQAALRLGYQGLELRVDAGHEHRVEVPMLGGERKLLLRIVQDANLEICCLATGLQLVHESVAEDAVPRIELAADMNCRAIRVLCGPAPEFISHQDMLLRMGEHLRHVAELAQGYDVQVWLQTHDTAALAADAAAVVRAANHDQVGIVYDTLHPYRRGESLDATIAALTGLVRHVHFHDGVKDPHRVIVRPLRQGDLPLDDMFLALVRMGYEGYLIGEWFEDQMGPNVDDALQSYASDIDALARSHQQSLLP